MMPNCAIPPNNQSCITQPQTAAQGATQSATPSATKRSAKTIWVKGLMAEYSERTDGLWCRYKLDGKLKTVRISNFTARITDITVTGNDSNVTRQLRIQGQLSGQPLREVRIPAEQFESGKWISKYWKPHAQFNPRMRDHVIAAISAFSPVKIGAEKTDHQQTGWKQIDGKWSYLMSNGAINDDGFDQNVVNSLPGTVALYSAGRLLNGAKLQASILSSLEFLNLASDEISFPLFSSIFIAPLIEAMPVNFSLYLHGPTGTFKTEVAAIMQSFYGKDFRADRLPGNWFSTSNAIERKSHFTKDVLLVVDDYNPNVAKMSKSSHQSDQVLRGSANRTGRDRLYRETYYSRGFIVCTGEILPDTCESLLERLLIVQIQNKTIKSAVLTLLQELSQASVFSDVLTSYIVWLAPKLDELKLSLPARVKALRDQCVIAKCHPRVKSNVALLEIGLEAFLDFAVDSGALTDHERYDYHDRGCQALLQAAQGHVQIINGARPSDRFIQLLQNAFHDGKAHLKPVKGNPNSDNSIEWTQWGWSDKSGQLTSCGPHIGFIDHDHIFLLPKESYTILKRIADERCESLPMMLAVEQDLDVRGWIITDKAKRGTYTSRKMINGQRYYPLVIRRHCFMNGDSALN